MNKEIVLYYIECTCIRDCNFPNTSFKTGDIVYINPNASSKEMYIWNPYINTESLIIQHAKRYSRFGTSSYMSFTRQKRNAKKWKVKRYPERIVNIINSYGEFNAVIKEIKVTYTEEENVCDVTLNN